MTGMLDSEIIGLRVEMEEVYPTAANIIDKPVQIQDKRMEWFES